MNNLNESQQKAVESTSTRIVCLAGAGTGKSHTLISRISDLISNRNVSANSILALTFTNAAAAEMRRRFNEIYSNLDAEFRTFHGFCYKLICTDRAVRNAIGYTNAPSIIDDAALNSLANSIKLQFGINLSDSKLKSDGEKLNSTDKFKYDVYHKKLRSCMIQKNVITFDNLCRSVCDLFISDHSSISMYKDKFKYIFVDEFQDTDKLQWSFVSSFKDASIFVCGDALQCQPAGCLVELASGDCKPIEEIVVGDKVKAYNLKEGYYTTAKTGKEVVKVATRFADNIVEVKSASHSSRYTKDHLTYARIHLEGNENCRCVYLMCNSEKGWWRVGECQLFLYNGDDFGPKHRMYEEGADKVWILDICNNSKEASWYTEQLAAFKFGIPDTTWQFMNVGRYTPETMQELYDSIPDIAERAEKCLEYFGRDINYPFFDKYKDRHRHMSKFHMFEVHVGNLIPILMDVVTPELFVDGHNAKRYNSPRYHNTYEQIIEISPCEPGNVYSLEVDHYHNYVSDGILTHNCIYQFRGTSNNFIKTLSESDNWEKIKLFKNYRSTNQICKFANSMSKYADDSYRICIDSDTQGEDVIVLPICRGVNDIYNVMNELQDRPGTSAILCRTNEEVRSVCSILKSKSISYWTGKSKYSDKIELLRCIGDISYSYDYMFDKLNEQEQTIVLSENLDVKTFDELYEVFYRFETCKHNLDIISKLANVLCSSTLNCIKVADALKILDISIEISDDIDCDAIDYLLDKLKCVSSEGVYVGTIHSSKGLEYDNVYLLNVGSDKFKLNCEENYNLYYVGITRAKNTLTVFLDDRYIL